MRFDGPVLFHPDAGVVDAYAAVAAWSHRVREGGGRILDRTRVLSVEPTVDGALVHTHGPTSSGSTTAARPRLRRRATA